MSRKGHRRHAHRTVGWQQRQDWNTRAMRQEHGSTLIDRAMGRAWPTQHSDLLHDALERTTATERFYVWRTPGQQWQIGRYAVR